MLTAIDSNIQVYSASISLARIAVLTILGAALSGCRPPHDHSQGVELVTSTEAPTPAMTFELRFEPAMVREGEVGPATTNSPMVITPPLAGTFTWLSTHSGVFVPAGPLVLDRHYELTLRRGLQRADGQPARVSLRRTLTTPSFGVTATWPHSADFNAPSEPEIKLLFNADVRAEDAQRYLYFRDESWNRVPADVRQGTVEEVGCELGGARSQSTWAQEFARARNSNPSGSGSEPGDSPTNIVANLLIVTPRSQLPLGKGWRLVIGTGLPSADSRLRLREMVEVPVGDVTPFVVTGVTARNYIGSGARFQFQFSKPLPESLTNGIPDWLEITPCPTNLMAQPGWRSLTLLGDLEGETLYTLKLKPPFKSSEGFALAGTNTFTLWMPRVPPRLYFPALSRDQLAGGSRSFPLLAVNVPQVRVRAKLLDPQSAIHALRGYGSYFAGYDERRQSGNWDEPYRSVDYNLVPGRTVFDDTLALDAAPDTSKKLDLAWDLLLAGRRTGVVFLDAERADGDASRAPALGTQALIQLTDLGLVWKRARTGIDVFVFSHATGQPVPGAFARLFSNENEPLREAVTDDKGLAHLGAHTNADWVAVQLDEDFHAAVLKDDQIWRYHFDVPVEGSDEREVTRRVMLFSDRNVYCPQEEVHLEAMVRDWGKEGLHVPVGLTGRLDCVDARGRQFFQTNVAFSPSGGWSAPIQLPATSRGTYSARLHLGTNEHPYPFQVQDFQPNAFEVVLQSKPSLAAGESVAVPVSARYLFGKALSRAQVKWWLQAEDTEFKPEGFGSFNFRRTDFESRFGRGNLSMTLNGQGTLGGSSNLVISADLPVNNAAPQPRLASLLVDVTDLNQQTISRRVEFVRHSSDFYLGLRQETKVLKAGEAVPLEVAAVRADGQPWPESVKAQLTLQRIDWQPVRIQGAGRTIRYRNEAVVTNVLEQEIEVQPIKLPTGPQDEVAGNRIPGLPPLQAGQYLIVVQAKDSGGRAVVSSLEFEVSAPASIGWDYRNDVHLALKPDRKVYAPGQAAEILVAAPFSGIAYVSVEREKVLRSFTTRLEGNAPSIRVPLEPCDVPNVFVSVTLVRGADECPRKVKEPEYRIGCCELGVEDPLSRLAVTVCPGATNYLPAQPVEVTVQVADAGGSPVAGANVVLYAVDEGILHLTAYELPDLHGFFYATRPLGVQTSISLPNLLPENPEELHFENKGYLGGGGGMDRMRKNFLACAYWNAAMTTDNQGKVTARFTAPDSLTRYRTFAVAHTVNSHFGGGQSVFQVSKPLLIEPALPAFANITDHLIARGLVQNQTATPGEVVVTLELDGNAKTSELGAALTRQVTIPANGSAVVEFPVELTDAGKAAWLWKARFLDPAVGTFTDAVQSALDVGHVVPMLREVLLSHATGDSQTNLLTRANPQLLAGQGTITVHIANTRLNDLGETVSQLLHYPYGCAEQTGSSLLPWIVLRDVTSLLPLLNHSTNDVEAAIHAGIARLFTMQTRSGGLGYWPRAKEPMLWASAYGATVLALAQRHGIEVPKEDFASLLDYLRQQLRSASGDDTNLGDYCLGLYALALAGRAEPAYHEKLYSLREKLGAEDRALLALAIAECQGPPQMVGQLLRPGPTSRRRLETSFGCSSREQAIRLLAWIHYRPDDRMVDRLVEDLMRDQKQAHWGSTQGDAWSLLALTEYARQVEGQLQRAEGQLTWGGQSVSFHLDDRTNIFTQTLATTNLAGADLTLINTTTNRLYTSVSVEARPPVAQQPRQDRGFGLQRRYERLDDDNHLRDLHGLRVGDRVLVTLDLSVHETARFVAVDDSLPSILEAVNPEFKTQEAGPPAPAPDNDREWLSSFREIRKDRCLYFADWIAPGNYTIRYVARVRAAGTVTAPSAKIEEMYHPERYGLSGTQTVSSEGLQ
jgi:alpha-2-macroglobulin